MAAGKNIEFGLILRAATDDARTKFAEVMKDIHGIRDAADKSKKSIAEPADAGTAAFGALQGAVGRFIATYATIAGIRALGRISDEAELITSRLKQASGETENFRVTQEALFQLAQRLGVAYDAVAQSFTRMAPAVKELGGGANEAIKLAEILAVTARLAGASQQEATSSAIQFAQALGSGVLQGDELKSILENNQVLARQLASALGVSIGQLRKLGEDGKLTADVVANALLGRYEEIKKAGQELPETIASAMTRVTNAFDRLVAKANEGSGVFGVLAAAIKAVADVLEIMAGQIEITDSETEKLERKKALTNFSNTAARSIAFLVNQVAAAISAIKALANSVFAVDSASQKLLKGDFSGAWQDMVQGGKRSAADLTQAWKLASLEVGTYARVVAQQEALANSGYSNEGRNSRGPLLRGGKKDDDKSKGAGKNPFAAAQALAKAEIEAEIRLIKDGYDRELKVLQAAFEDQLLAIGDFYTKKEGLRRTDLEDQLKRKREELTATQRLERSALNNDQKLDAQAKQKSILADITILERDLRDLGVDSARERAKATKDLNAELLKVRVELDKLSNGNKQSSAVLKESLDAQYETLEKKLRVEAAAGNQAAAIALDQVASIKRLTVAQNELNAAVAEFERIERESKAAEGSITARRQAGRITEAQAQRELNQLYKETAEKLEASLPKIEQYKEAFGPDATARVQELRNKIEGLKKATDDWATDAGNAIKNNLSSGIDGMVDNIGRLDQAFGKMLENLGKDLLKLSLKRFILKPLADVIDAIMQGGKGDGKDKSRLITDIIDVPVAHTGGVIGSSALARRSITPFAFAGAPRYHSGGIAGLRPDEVPAILQAGEEVLKASDPRHRANAAAGGVVVNVHEAPGQGGRVEQSSKNGQTQIDVFIEQFDSRLASRIANGQGDMATLFNKAGMRPRFAR